MPFDSIGRLDIEDFEKSESIVKPRPETFAKLDEFCRFPWFKNCGETLEGDYTRAASWSEVKRRVQAERWRMVQDFFHHRGFIGPLQRGPARGQRIRDIFLDPDLRSNLHQLCFTIHQRVEKYDWPSGLEGFGPITESVRWDLIHALWEAEYSDLAASTAFSEKLIEIYRRGHVVAGWDGTHPRRNGRNPEGWFPEGRLRVF